MKKIVALLVLAMLVLTLFASCGKPFTCDLCGEEKTGKKYTKEILGAELDYCNECKKELDNVGDEIEDLGENIGQGIEDLGEELGDLFN